MTESTSTHGARWWEGYAIRYGVGTVVGGVVFYMLCTLNKSLTPFLFDAPKKFESSHVALLAAYGFAYCYLASAPILVFHASRWMLKVKLDLDDMLFRMLVTLSIPLIIASAIYNAHPSADVPTKVLFGTASFVLALFVWLQVLAISCNLLKPSEVFAFYVRLAQERKSVGPELVESYRHLREHGNAFFVVFLEIAFALVLFAAGEFLRLQSPGAPQSVEAVGYVLAVFLWASPAAAVWLVGNAIERRIISGDG